MSFLFGGGGRPQPTSEQKIAAAETEVEMVSDVYARYDASTNTSLSPLIRLQYTDIQLVA
jgi:mitochondrial import inner membrane translocase subunit TIM10